MTLVPTLTLPVKSHNGQRPLRHQIEAAAFALREHPATAILHEMGTGKTLTSIAIAGLRYARGDISRLLVVTPASVLDTWAVEFDKWADYDYELRVLYGSTARRRDMLEARWSPGPLQVAVINYEAVWRMYDAVRDWVGEVGLIVADESPKIKSPGSKQSKAMHNLGRTVPYRQLNTGTPVTHSPLDVYSQWKFADPSIFGNSFIAYRNQYAIERQMRAGWRLVVGFRNLDDLASRAHLISHRVRRADVLDLPPALGLLGTDFPNIRYAHLDPQPRRVYDNLVEESVTELANGERLIVGNVLTKLLRLSQLAGGFLENEAGRVQQIHSAKLDLLEGTLDEILEDDHKVIVFTRFRAEMYAIEQMLARKGLPYEKLDGSVPLEHRGEIVARFNEQRDLRIFLIQIQAGGLGLNLQSADTAIFYSLDYSYGNYEQAAARIYRSGQERPCTFIHLVVRDTVDEKVIRALNTKRNLADLVVDNWRDVFA